MTLESIGDVIKKQQPDTLKKYEELAKQLLENPLVKEFIAEHKPTEEEIQRGMAKINEFVRERAKFDAGLGTIAGLYEPTLILNSGYVDVAYRTTDNLKKQQLARSTYGMLKYQSILSDESIKKATFQSFIAEKDEEKAASSFASVIADRYLAGETFTTVFVGDVGAGKSHLAMSVLDYVNKKAWVDNMPKKVLFVSFPELIDKIKDSFNNYESHYNEERTLELMKSADLLVIDDLGRESNLTSGKTAGDWLQKFIFKLFESPNSKIITTNLDESGLKSIYNAGNASRILRNSFGNTFAFTGISDKRMKGY